MQVKRSAGVQAEALAADFLMRQGLRILERNWRIRGGEIDLICADGNTLVFVEVRLRSSGAFGGAAASITLTKQRRITLAARHYLATQKHSLELPCRFDAVLFDGTDLRPEWIKNAFDAP